MNMQKRTKRIHIAVYPEEFEIIRDTAKLNGYSVGGWIRNIALQACSKKYILPQQQVIEYLNTKSAEVASGLVNILRGRND